MSGLGETQIYRQQTYPKIKYTAEQLIDVGLSVTSCFNDISGKLQRLRIFSKKSFPVVKKQLKALKPLDSEQDLKRRINLVLNKVAPQNAVSMISPLVVEVKNTNHEQLFASLIVEKVICLKAMGGALIYILPTSCLSLNEFAMLVFKITLEHLSRLHTEIIRESYDTYSQEQKRADYMNGIRWISAMCTHGLISNLDVSRFLITLDVSYDHTLHALCIIIQQTRKFTHMNHYIEDLRSTLTSKQQNVKKPSKLGFALTDALEALTKS